VVRKRVVKSGRLWRKVDSVLDGEVLLFPKGKILRRENTRKEKGGRAAPCSILAERGADRDLVLEGGGSLPRSARGGGGVRLC